MLGFILLQQNMYIQDEQLVNLDYSGVLVFFLKMLYFDQVF